MSLLLRVADQSRFLTRLSSFGFWAFRRLFLHRIGDQPRAVVVREVCPCPFAHHKKPIAEADQEQQMNEQPCQPGKVAGEMWILPRKSATACERPMVARLPLSRYSNSSRGLPSTASLDLTRGKLAHLDGCRRNARNRLAVVTRGRSQIAGNKNFRMAGHGEIGLNNHTTGFIGGDAQHFAQRRRGNARAPEDDRRREFFLCPPKPHPAQCW